MQCLYLYLGNLVCVWTFVWGVGMHVSVLTWKDKLMLDVLLCHSPFCAFRDTLLLELKIADSTSIISQLAPGIPESMLQDIGSTWKLSCPPDFTFVFGLELCSCFTTRAFTHWDSSLASRNYFCILPIVNFFIFEVHRFFMKRK